MKYDTQPNPNYYAVIPAEVRYCKGLEPNAKLLYGEISALCHQEGYCWANNRYFANLYDVDNRSIQNWLKSLQENNFIVVTDDGNQDNPKRLIYLAHAFQISVTRKNLHGGVKKSSRGGEKIFIHNNTSNTTSINPPLSSPPKERFKKKPVEKKREEEDIFIHDCLNNTVLSDKEKYRQSRDYPQEQVAKALEIAKTQTIKKTLMHLLLNILDNPGNWPDPQEAKKQSLTPIQQQALEYNEKLRNTKGVGYEINVRPGEKEKRRVLNADIAKQNDTTILEANSMLILLNGFITGVSLKSIDFAKDIKDAIAQLR